MPMAAAGVDTDPIGYRFGSGCNLECRKSGRLPRQFAGFFIFHAPD
jgi:hypothetical protein